MASDRKKGHFTFRTAAVLFMASAALELINLGAEIPLFGEIVGGIGAGAYHLFFAALFLALGIGLWRAAGWGYKLVFVTTAAYTLDKIQLLLGLDAVKEYVRAYMPAERLATQGITDAMIMQVIAMTAVVAIFCWWGFALYAHIRRDYFKKSP